MKVRLVVFLILFLLPVSALAQVEIVEVMCNPVGSDTDGEWVKIKNAGSGAVDITGWKFNDGSNHSLNTPPKNGGVGSMSLAAGSEAYLARDAAKVSLSGTVIDTAMALNNTTDELSLIDGSGAVASTYMYTSDAGFDEGVLCAGSGTAAGTSGTASDSGTASPTTPTVVTTYKEVTKWETVTVQPPEDIYIRDIPDKDLLVGSVLQLYPEVYDATGAVVKDVPCIVSFGDGVESKQCSSKHIYTYAGEYVAVISVQQGALRDSKRVVVRVTEPQLQVHVDKGKSYVEIINNAPQAIELNGWSIKVGYKRYTLPTNTIVMASSSIKLSESATKIDLRRYGGVAELLNTFGKAVANSAEYAQAQAQQVPTAVATSTTTELSEPVDASAVEPATPVVEAPAATVEQARPKRHSSKKSRGAPALSIIGTPVVVQSAAALVGAAAQPAEAVNKGVKSEVGTRRESQVAAAAGAPAARARNTPWQWLVGILALVGLAMTPILFKGKVADSGTSQGPEGGSEPSDAAEGASSFSIKEVT